MGSKFNIGQCVRIIFVRELSRRYPNDIVQGVKKHKGKTGDIAVISSNTSGHALADIEPVTEDIYCEVELHKSKQKIRVPVEALEPC